ncbi:MAG: non-ribosomal peptide synthetase [Clostridia bacterium]|nr:non-ribosomal peptide synthetase [Clostridia bacterium]
MNKTYKRIMQNVKRLSLSKRRFKDIYDIVFSNGDLVMTEQPTMTRKVFCTYAQAQALINDLAKGIISQIGVTNGYIALCGENCLQWMIAFWAILKSGNKPYLINLRQPVHFTNEILNTLNTSAIIKIGCENLDFNGKCYHYQEVIECGQKVAAVDFPPFENQIAISTSGTTLSKKICIYTGSEISAQLINVEGISKLNRDIIKPYKGAIKQLMFLPLYHVFGLVAVFLWYSLFGASFVFLPDMSAESILRTVRNHKITHIFAVPLLWHSFEKGLLSKVKAQKEGERNRFFSAIELSYKLQRVFPHLGKAVAVKMLDSVRKKLFGKSVTFCISGGSFIKQSTLKLINSLGYVLVNGYGMSEVCIPSVECSKNIKIRVNGAIGLPFDSVEYKIGDKNQLLVKGSSVCKRLIVDGKEIINDGWFDTGDVVRVDKSGRYYIEGRISDIVFSDDGENLNPDLAEKSFSLSSAVNFSVLGSEDNSKLMLVVQVAKGITGEQISQLAREIEDCNASLPQSYKVKEIYFTYDEIMTKGSIKVSRSYLKGLISENKVRLFKNFEEGSPVCNCNEEGSEVKQFLIELFARLLDADKSKIDCNANFMLDLGGSSLDYFTLIGEINEKYGITLKYEEGSDFGYSVNDFEKKITQMINEL